MTRWQTMMVNYGSAHQNRVNVWMHILGVPVIVLGVLAAAATVHTDLAGVTVSGAWLISAAGLAFYWGLDRQLTAVIAVAMVAEVALAQGMAGWGTSSALVWGAAMFFGGFAFQFIGHAIEGRKPALMNGNPLVAMLTAPMFIVAELHWMLGKRTELETFMQAELARLEADQEPAAEQVPA